MTIPERFDTSINLQNLLSAVVIAGGMIAWGMSMQSRISVVESVQHIQAEIDKRQDNEKDRLQDQLQDQINTQFKSLNDKLDRLIEQHAGRP